MLKILNAVKYFPLWQFSEIIDCFISENIDYYKNPRVTILGEATGSSQILGYLMSHSWNNIKLDATKINYSENVKESLKLTNKGDTLLFVDDCIISGKQTINTIDELFGIRKLELHHQIHCEKLEARDSKELLKRKLVFIFCVGTTYGKEELEKHLKKLKIKHEIFIGYYSDLNNRVFTPNNDIGWASIEERESLESFCREKGYEVLKEISVLKKWNESRHKESALGYSDLQRLLIFPYSIPKTTLPILWCRSENWMPLFETPD